MLASLGHIAMVRLSRDVSVCAAREEAGHADDFHARDCECKPTRDSSDFRRSPALRGIQHGKVMQRRSPLKGAYLTPTIELRHDEKRQDTGAAAQLFRSQRSACSVRRWCANVLDGRRHSWLGLGDMPSAPVVEYLARSISAFYALFGGICLALATDLRRYRPLVRLMGLFVVAMGAAFIGIDLSATMPWWWSTIEGPTTIIGGATMFLLARPALENG